MGVIKTTAEIWEVNRHQTLGLVDAIAELPNPGEALAWRPGPGRAHLAWQLMHIGITEELFATERLLGEPPAFADLVPRFKGGSTPDDDIPDLSLIREVLEASRRHLLRTVSRLSEDDLQTIPEALPEPLRSMGWTLGRVLQVLTWHEGHHQGQGHLTLNLYKGAMG